jgi:hypothetical protein
MTSVEKIEELTRQYKLGIINLLDFRDTLNAMLEED